MHFNHIIMNPPWNSAAKQDITEKIFECARKFSDNIVMLSSANYIFQCSSKYKNPNKKYKEWLSHAESIYLADGNSFFDIDSRITMSVVAFNFAKTFDFVDVLDEFNPSNDNWTGKRKIGEIMDVTPARHDLFLKTKPLYDELIKNGGMAPHNQKTNEHWEYFENRNGNGKSATVKNTNSLAAKYLEDGKYKFCLNRTRYEHLQDPYYDSVKNDGGITWLCDKENVRNNMYYWLRNCKLTFFWRKYLNLSNSAGDFFYDKIPCVDFDRSEDEFIAWAKSLVDESIFTEDVFPEIKDLDDQRPIVTV